MTLCYKATFLSENTVHPNFSELTQCWRGDSSTLSLFVWNSNKPCIPWHGVMDFFSCAHCQQNTSFSWQSEQSRGDLGGIYSIVKSCTERLKLRGAPSPKNAMVPCCGKASYLGSFSGQRCDTGSRQKNRFLVINSRLGLESVSFLTEDQALSWNVSCRSAATASFSGTLTFNRAQTQGWRERERKLYVTWGCLGLTQRDTKIWVAVAVCLKGITI